MSGVLCSRCHKAFPMSGTLCEACWTDLGQQALFDITEAGYVLASEFESYDEATDVYRDDA